jgi:hypothetical protein
MTCIVYVNHPTSKARVHRLTCQNYWKRKGDSTPNGYWAGPFEDLEKALNFAKNTGKLNISKCRECI